MVELAEIYLQELDTARRKMAFEHWMMTCNRDCAEVAGKMGLDAATIKDWEQEEGWSLRAKKFLAGIDEDMQVKIRTNVAFGADESAQYMRQVVQGVVEPNKDRLFAARELMYMAGFAPNTNNRPEALRKPGRKVNPAEIQAMSEAEIKELEAAIQEKHIEENKEAFDKATRRK